MSVQFPNSFTTPLAFPDNFESLKVQKHTSTEFPTCNPDHCLSLTTLHQNNMASRTIPNRLQSQLPLPSEQAKNILSHRVYAPYRVLPPQEKAYDRDKIVWLKNISEKQKTDDLKGSWQECVDFLNKYADDPNALDLKRKAELGILKLQRAEDMLKSNEPQKAHAAAMDVLALFPENKAAMEVIRRSASLNIEKSRPDQFNCYYIGQKTFVSYEIACKMYQDKQYLAVRNICDNCGHLWKDRVKAQALLMGASCHLLLQSIKDEFGKGNFTDVLKLCQKFSSDYPTMKSTIAKYQSSAIKNLEKIEQAKRAMEVGQARDAIVYAYTVLQNFPDQKDASNIISAVGASPNT